MLVESAAGLWCEAGRFHIDPWQPVERAVITHAHGDHARPGSQAYLCATPCVPLLKRRFGADARIESLPYGQPVTLGSVRVSFHPAGHVLGSAQVRIEAEGRVWVVAGDYKRVADPTCEPFVPIPCDTFITESTFGLPIYRWDPTASVMREIVEWWDQNRDEGRASVLFCYTIGKAQRVLAELAALTDRPVFVHGMMLAMIEAYRESGIRLLPVHNVIEPPAPASARATADKPRPTSARRATAGKPRGRTAFAGELILAPLPARGTPWMRRLGEHSDAFASGLMRVRGVRRQRAFDRGFVLSDHADWPDLLRTIEETGAERVLATHGHAEPLARFLRECGRDSGVIRTAWEGEDIGD